MQDNAARFLAFAFASAELLFEIDPDGRIVLAIGATQKLFGLSQEEMVGQHWNRLFAPEGRPLVGALIDGLEPADRRGPVRAQLQSAPGRQLKRFAAFSACRLPQVAPNISCALSLGAIGGQVVEPKGPNGLQTRNDFEAAADALLLSPPGIDLDVAFVQFDGLSAAAASAGPPNPEDLAARVAAAVLAESYAGQSASLVGEDRFAMLRPSAEAPEQFLNRLTKACVRAGAEVTATGVTVDPSTDSAKRAMRALQFALNVFIKDGAQSAGQAFGAVLAETKARAAAFSQTVTERRFRLVYQPIVDLKTGDLHHFEVLSRLEQNDSSPAQMIQMAEDLDLIHDLDMAVADQTMRKLAAPGNSRLKLAVNLSGRSLMRPGFVQTLLTKGRDINVGGRLIFEVTETAALGELESANAHIQALRKAGFAVCLDDFGAGAAALSYLHAMTFDIVKIDGQYIKELEHPGRADTVVRHVSRLCTELKIRTVAEMVETQSVKDILTEIGIELGQGYFFGRPTTEPIYERTVAPLARRAGAKESWG